VKKPEPIPEEGPNQLLLADDTVVDLAAFANPGVRSMLFKFSKSLTNPQWEYDPLRAVCSNSIPS
jgi:hypothetical protein